MAGGLKNNQPKSIRGGKRPGAGRPKGAPNKATADIRAAASEYSADALAVLVQVATSSDSDAARVAAANSILDRAHGKPRQSVEVDASVTASITEIRRIVVDPRHSDT